MSVAEMISDELRLENFFTGNFTSEGFILKPNGAVVKKFHVDGKASFRKGTLTLKEYFEYDDGTDDMRVWQILCLPDGSYEGHTVGLIGQPPKAMPVGPLFQWSYKLKIPIGKISLGLRFDDNMQIHDAGISNVAIISKFGLPVLKISQLFKPGF